MALIGPKILWPSLSKAEIKDTLATDFVRGLSMDVVLDRRSKYGKNTFQRLKKASLFKKVLKQLKNPLVTILLIAGLITLFLGEYVDTIVIFIAVAINILIGTLQEEKASKAFEKLNRSQQKFAAVIRDNKKFLVPAQDLVKGDLILMEAGNFVPADIRLIGTNNFEVNESALTGEWIAAPKSPEPVDRDKPLSEQSSMAWMGTLVASGNAKGVVVEIGSRTQIGAIAESLSEAGKEIPTPIQKNIRKIAKFLAIFILLIVSGIFVLGISKGQPLGDMLLIAVAIAVSVIPEGLPAAVTVVLVLGMERILNKGGLVKNLLAAETLGSTTIILTDKTGTLTKGNMRLASAYTLSTLEESESSEDDRKALIKMAVLSSDAYLEEDQKEEKIIIRGRPLEKAIVLAGLEAGINYGGLNETDGRIDFLPFDSENAFLASLNYVSGTKEKQIYFSGSPEKILERSNRIMIKNKAIKLSEVAREEFKKVQEKWSRQGLRFLAVAYKETKLKSLPEKNIDEVEDYEDLIFVGLLSFEDSIREDVPASIKKAMGAGARVLMVTGDNKFTAHKIAQDAGIATLGDRVLTGGDIEKMNDKDLLEALRKVKVFARVLPSQKLRISRVLQKAGEIVAMTGDGVNDAPALRGAHIGVAVNSGTEVAKEASDLILLNNSFSVIVVAIEEGRRIMDNLRKVVSFLLDFFGFCGLTSGIASANFAGPNLVDKYY